MVNPALPRAWAMNSAGVLGAIHFLRPSARRCKPGYPVKRHSNPGMSRTRPSDTARHRSAEFDVTIRVEVLGMISQADEPDAPRRGKIAERFERIPSVVRVIAVHMDDSRRWTHRRLSQFRVSRKKGRGSAERKISLRSPGRQSRRKSSTALSRPELPGGNESSASDLVSRASS